MDYSVKTHLLLQETDDSENEFENENLRIERTNDDVTYTTDTKPLFKPVEPVDKYKMCYLIFYLLGITSLLPWNFFITADDYWMYKFRKIDHDNSTRITATPGNRTPLQKEFTSYLSIASAVPNTLFLILSTVTNRIVPLQIRMVGSLIITFIFFVFTTVLVNINTDEWQETFFIITMASVVILNIACAILSGSVFGIIGKFSSSYITAVISGQALGGIFTAIVEIISLASGESSVKSAFLYYMVGNIVIVFTLIAYIVLSKTVYFQFHLTAKPDTTSATVQNELLRSQRISYRSILNKIWVYGISEWLVFIITLSVYPGVTVLIESQDKGSGNAWSDLYFVPVVSYLIFSTGDYVGRILAGHFEWPKNEMLILALNFTRLGFIPLLLFCNAQPRHHLPVLIIDDFYYILIMCFFSLTNGYLANLAVICAPGAVDHHEKEVASSMMAAFLGVGLSMGSILSLIMVKII